VYFHDECGQLREIPAGWTDFVKGDTFVEMAAGLFTTSSSGGQYRVSCSLSEVAAGTSGTVMVCVNYDLPAGATTDCSNVIKLAEPGAHRSLNVVECMRAISPVSYYTTVVANQGARYQVGCSAEQEQ
jgi:hypothetical protein